MYWANKKNLAEASGRLVEAFDVQCQALRDSKPDSGIHSVTDYVNTANSAVIDRHRLRAGLYVAVVLFSISQPLIAVPYRNVKRKEGYFHHDQVDDARKEFDNVSGNFWSLLMGVEDDSSSFVAVALPNAGLNSEVEKQIVAFTEVSQHLPNLTTYAYTIDADDCDILVRIQAGKATSIQG